MYAAAAATLGLLLVIVADATSASNETSPSPIHAGLLRQAQQSAIGTFQSPVRLTEDSSVNATATKIIRLIASPDPYCVVPKLYGDYSACCGSEVYDWRFNVCCNGMVFVQTTSPMTACCGDVPYEYDEYVCCYPSMTLKYKTYGAYSGCCGSCENATVYDYRNTSCCNDVAVYHPETEVCCNNGTIVKDVGPNAPYSFCCGSSVYDYRTELCCDGVVLPNNAHQQMYCCGNTSVNSTTQGCCVQYVETPSTSVVGSAAGLTPPGRDDDPHYSYTIYDLETQFCCGGIGVMPRLYGSWSWCCGSEVYNYSASVCCNGKVVEQTFGWYSYCCGGTVVDSRTTYCCYINGTNDIPYDAWTQICCDGIIKDRTFDWESGCCGTAVYNYSSSTCCNGVVHCVTPGTSYCCGNHLYDYQTELCCYGCSN